jgi:uncharacterized protein (UPF0276 family)
MRQNLPHGAGLGLRRELIPDLRSGIPDAIEFLELAPENWLDMGGQRKKDLRHFAERLPLVAHGLSLNLGGPAPLDEISLGRVKRFLDEHGIALYTEHLSWCGDDGHLYDLLPIPFTGDAVRHVAKRIRRAQEILERRIAIENASYYVAPAIAEMDELTFIRAVLEEADCDLHLDVNNVYVNSVNFCFDPRRRRIEPDRHHRPQRVDRQPPGSGQLFHPWPRGSRPVDQPRGHAALRRP